LLQERRIRTGVFLPPHHSNDEDVSLAVQRDLQLVQWLEELGYAEFWIGEHHSGGMQIYGSPELFIAAAAERTSTIKLGAGVISVPYHHPFMVANRMIQLDHQTRGRAMFGFGPGMLVSDATMLGIEPDKQRTRLAEGLDVIARLLDGEVVSQQTDWFTLREARLHISPYSNPRPQLAIASSKTATGQKLAGRYNMGILIHGGGDVRGAWEVATDSAKEYGQQLDISNLRVVASMHLAETRQEAVEAVKFGFEPWMDYLGALNPDAYAKARAESGHDVEKLIKGRGGVVGTPDDAVAFLEALWERTGGFGCLLLAGTNWMNFEATKRSYELLMRHVMPRFDGRNKSRQDSFDWMYQNRATFSSAGQEAIKKTVAAAETGLAKTPVPSANP
jgi:limonene 1,2-monooxygenase